MLNPEKRKTIEWLIINYMPFLETFGMQEENIRTFYQEWTTKFGDNVGDFLWNIFNKLLNENASQATDLILFYEQNIDLYMQMLYFRRKIEGKAANEIHQTLNRNKLELQFESSSLELSVIISTANDCDACKEISNKEYPIREVIKNDVIPYEKCNRERGCICGYTFKPLRDENNSLIRKRK